MPTSVPPGISDKHHHVPLIQIKAFLVQIHSVTQMNFSLTMMLYANVLEFLLHVAPSGL